MQEKGLFKLERIRGSQREGKEAEGGREGSLLRQVSGWEPPQVMESPQVVESPWVGSKKAATCNLPKVKQSDPSPASAWNLRGPNPGACEWFLASALQASCPARTAARPSGPGFPVWLFAFLDKGNLLDLSCQGLASGSYDVWLWEGCAQNRLRGLPGPPCN